MLNKSTGSVPGMSSKENLGGFTPRAGQQAVVTFLESSPDNKKVAAKLPGGYGKSIAMALAYQQKREAGLCNRLLIIVANDNQREQIRHDFASDCKAIGMNLCGIWTFSREANTVRAHMENRVEVFVATIQQVSSTARSDIDTMLNLIGSGNWMLAADEYHHYAEERDWGSALKRITDKCVFTLALSATPDRDGTPTIFGDPHIIVSYREGIKENALKDMKVASYHYAIDLFTNDGEVLRYTTDELLAEIGDAKNIDVYEEKRQIRYSNKYIHPLILHPVTRLEAARANTGQKLQLLIRAMSCRHAQTIAEQVKGLLADSSFAVEWVGTGPNGRPDDENREICKKFCPPKEHGSIKRPAPSIDVLVQVGMAGEGFDPVLVTEIVDLSLVKLEGAATQSKQFYLRGSRWMPGIEKEYQVCTINIPSDHRLTLLADKTLFDGGRGTINDCKSIIDWIDSPGGNIDDTPFNDAPEAPQPREWQDEVRPLDPNAFAKMVDQHTREIELISITQDDPHFVGWVGNMNKVSKSYERQQWDVSNQDDFDVAAKMYKSVVQKVGSEQDEQMMLADARERVDNAVGKISKIMVMAKSRQGDTTDKSHFGDQKKRINGVLFRRFGKRDKLMVEELRMMYEELVELERSIRNGEIPSWAA